MSRITFRNIGLKPGWYEGDLTIGSIDGVQIEQEGWALYWNGEGWYPSPDRVTEEERVPDDEFDNQDFHGDTPPEGAHRL